MYVLEDVRCGLQVVAELGHLRDAKTFDQFAALGHEILAARQPNLTVYLSLLDESLKAFYIDQKAQAQGRNANES